MLNAVAQHVDDAALGDLALQPVQELQPLRSILGDAKRLDSLGLCRVEEVEQLRQVNGVVPVEILRSPGDVTRLVNERADDEAFEAFLAGVRRHQPACNAPASIQPFF